MAICSLHGLVPDAELSWNDDCGELHVPPGRTGHTLTGEPCRGTTIPGTDRTVGATGAAAAAEAEAANQNASGTRTGGTRGPMAADSEIR